MLKLGSERKDKLKTYPCVSVSCEEGYATYKRYQKGTNLHRSQYLLVAIIQCDMRYCDFSLI